MPYRSRNSWFHRLDPRVKLLLIVLAVWLSLLFGDVAYLGFFALALAILAFVSGIGFGPVLRFVKPIIPLFAFLLVFDGFFPTWGGSAIFSVGPFPVYGSGVVFGVALVLKMLTMVIASTLVIVSTDPSSVTLAIRSLGLPHELALMISIAMRFVPTLMGKFVLIQEAQKARGWKLGKEAGNVVKRIAALIPVLIPLFVSALVLADKLSLAMEARGFGASKNITYSRDLKLAPFDYAFAVTLIVIGVVALPLRLLGFGANLLGTLQALGVLRS